MKEVVEQKPAVEMYEVPGHGEITQHVLDRYQRDRNRFDQAMREVLVAQNQMTSEPDLIDRILSASGDERHELIIQALNDPDYHKHKFAAQMIWNAPAKEKIEIQQLVAQTISQALSGSDIELQRQMVELIEFAPSEQQAELVRQALNSFDVEVWGMAAEMISAKSFVLYEREELQQLVTQKIRQTLSESDAEAQKEVMELIYCAPSNQRADLIRLALMSAFTDVWRKAADLIRNRAFVKSEKNALQQLVAQKINQVFLSSDVEAQKQAAEIIWIAPEADRVDLILQALEISHAEVQKRAIKNIRSVDRDQQAHLIRLGLKSLNPEVQQEAAKMISSWVLQEASSLMNLALETNEPGVAKIVLDLTFLLPEEKRKIFREKALQILGDKLVEPPLYLQTSLGEDEFARAEFEKDGSETTLVGGDLYQKSIIRHIKPEAFQAWQKLYEDHELWKINGFDYVPIEPIISFRLEKKGTVAVFSGVLDINFEAWKNITSKFVEELTAQREKILAVLANQSLIHGHHHDGNFCLRFFRDDNGRIDMEKVPRLYLIDFDQAVSP